MAAQQEQRIDDGIDTTLATLYSSAPGSRELVGKARAVLVFPNVRAAGLVIGGEYGRGALQVDGKTVGYYKTNKTTGVSVGLQAGDGSGASDGVIAFALTNEGLMAATTVDGTKGSKLEF
jgi:lipid-binding SYLF domain-containing protein